jgi:phosphoadenosine phosphosulfate reductase
MQIVRDIDTDIGEDSPPERVVAWMLNRFAERRAERRLVMTTAFGMEGCALIDMIASHGVPVPVLYLDTGFLFRETLQLRDRLAARYPHLSFENRGTSLTPEDQESLYGPELWARDSDTCCNLRKVEPMRHALGDVDVWVTGLMRSQSPSRAGLRVVDWDWKYQLLKVNPLAGWDRAQVWEYVRQHGVPYNELHDRGFPTLGCTHCTRPVAGNVTGEYTREGRWRGLEKNECGLHHILGRAS